MLVKLRDPVAALTDLGSSFEAPRVHEAQQDRSDNDL
jgi:hypothetical protein